MNPHGFNAATRSIVTPNKQPGKMYRVFVVEDSPSIREALVGNLESTGLIEVIGSADSADAAWKDQRLGAADAIIIDLALRTSSGFELLSRLKSSPDFSTVPRIVLTNYAIAIFRERALSLGADYFFDKSLQFDQAVELLEKLARNHSPRDGGPKN
jgi:DNA-binding NarL/FixJ family response regulator